jgi:hypothetical protein
VSVSGSRRNNVLTIKGGVMSTIASYNVYMCVCACVCVYVCVFVCVCE